MAERSSPPAHDHVESPPVFTEDKLHREGETDVSKHSDFSSTLDPSEPTLSATIGGTEHQQDVLPRPNSTANIESDDHQFETWDIPKGHPKKRDVTELPLKARKASGALVTLWAEMDTGSPANFITEKLVERLERTAEIQALSSPKTLSELGVNHVVARRFVKLSFHAGRSDHTYTDVEFLILDETLDTDTDGLPDVLLCLDFIYKAHMLMVDIEFSNEPDPKLEVLAKRAKDEVPGGRTRKNVLKLKFEEANPSAYSPPKNPAPSSAKTTSSAQASTYSKPLNTRSSPPHGNKG